MNRSKLQLQYVTLRFYNIGHNKRTKNKISSMGTANELTEKKKMASGNSTGCLI